MFLLTCYGPPETLAKNGPIKGVISGRVSGGDYLFFGSMFLYLAPNCCEILTSLQLEFERSLLGLPPWSPPELVRAVAGWKLDWGEQVFYKCVVFQSRAVVHQAGSASAQCVARGPAHAG